ncbi:MAG: PAS domain-containing protein [Spirochaetales bacterium]|nr:PAS domain-containing protein [Spirochaetales bacterium]
MYRIFSNTHISIVYLNKKFDIIQVNKTYADNFKEKTSFFIGKNYFALNPGLEYKKIFNRVVKTCQPHIVFGKRFPYNKPDEKTKDRYWDWSLHPVKSNNKKVEGLILTLLDVTERVKAQMELEQTKDKLAQAKRMSDLGLLAATVAHELRNPLSVIQAALYNIGQKMGTAPIQPQLQTIETKIAEGDQIISNLLTYTKIQLPNRQKVNILTLLDETIEMVTLFFSNENIKVKKKFDNTFIRVIEVDPIQFKKVFNNILLNSFQAIKRKKGLVIINLKTNEKEMELSFIDNGCGIKKSDFSKVIEPFFTRKSKGTGLGLSICNEIINLHNGKLLVDSKLNKETVIKIILPFQN